MVSLFARRVVALLSLSFLCTFSGTRPAPAADGAPEPTVLPPLVISVTKLPTPSDEVASSVTVITADDIARKQLRTLPDALAAIPGLNVVQAGGPGAATTVFIRGTNANHTKVLVDGIDVSDPSSSNGAFDFAHLSTSDIARIEVLRGPQSGLYGSDAIGGVISITTKSGKGPAKMSVGAEVGSFGTFNQDAAISGSKNRFTYAFNAAHLRSNDVPVTPQALLPPGQRRTGDRYDNKTFSTKLGAGVSDDVDLGLVARYVDTSLLFTGDDFSVFPSVPASERSESDTRQIFTRATAHALSFDGRLDHTFGLAYSDVHRRDKSPDTDPTITRGDRVKADWQGSIDVTDGQTLVAGLEHQLDELRDSPISAHTTNNAGFIELQSRFGRRIFNTVTLRGDDNSRFGGITTYRIAPAVLFPGTRTKLKASLGTGFKAPSLQQLFVDFPSANFFANPNLKPEESLGYDVGFEQTVAGGAVRFGSTYFHNDIDNLITTNDSGTSYANVAEAETYGFETFATYRPIPALTLRADHTYTIADDAVQNQELLRRPKHKASLGATWKASDALSLSATAIYVGPWVDGNRDFSVPRLKADGYSVVNLAGSYDLGAGVTAFARIDNLFDTQYESPTGFQRPGFGVFAGVRVTFGLEGSTGGIEGSTGSQKSAP